MNSQNLIIGVLFLIVFGLGFLTGRVTGLESLLNDGDQKGVMTSVKSDGKNQSGESATQATGSSNETNEATNIDEASLTEGQRKLISALGLDPDNITITAEMVACAEAKLGSGRVEEIKNGATPSFTEGAKLVACYQ